MGLAEFTVTWILLFTVPKLFVIPIVKWMIVAVRDTSRQDALDAEWLEEYEAARRGADEGRGGPPVPRRFVPSGPRPTGGPERTGSRAAQTRTRRRPVRSRG
jgi:hypothetical protein